MKNEASKSTYNYRYYYNKISSWFLDHKAALKLLRLLYQILPIVYIISYMALIIITAVYYKSDLLLKILLVPSLAFVSVTILRKLLNCKRPYTKYDIVPLINKNKPGESFPSRHTLSACIIALSWFPVNKYVGIILLFISLVIGITRVLAGVHFIKDILMAVLISIFFYVIGFIII